MEEFDIGKKIAILRKKHSMTQKQLAEKLHISNKVISKWELGYSEPDIFSLRKISQIFNISADQLINKSSEIFDDNNNKKEKFLNFIRNHYIILIQIMLMFFALLDITIGYSLLSKNINSLYFGLILGFSLAVILIEIFILLINNKNKITNVFKILFTFFIVSYLILNIIFLCLVDNINYEKFFIVSIIFSFLMLVNSILNILKITNILSRNSQVKIGKILTAFLFSFLSLQIGFVIGNITTTSVMYSKEKSNQMAQEALMFYRYSYNFFNIGDSEQVQYIFITKQEASNLVDFYSNNEDIVSVTKEGLLTAINYGQTTVIATSGDYSVTLNVNVCKTTSDITISSIKQDVYAGEKTTINFTPFDYYSLLSKGKNLTFILRDDQGDESNAIKLIDYNIDLLSFTASIKINEKEDNTPQYVNIIVYDHDLKAYTHYAVIQIYSPVQLAFFESYQKVYSGNDQQVMFSKIDENYTDISNNLQFIIKDENGLNSGYIEVKDYQIVEDTIAVNIHVNSLSQSTSEKLVVMAFDEVLEKYVFCAKFTINDISHISLIYYDKFYVGEVVDIIEMYTPTTVITDFTITSSNNDVVEVLDDNKLYIKGNGKAQVTVTAPNGIKAEKDIIVEENLSMTVRKLTTGLHSVGDEIEFQIDFTDFRKPYHQISLLSAGLEIVEIREDGYGFVVVVKCLEVGDVGYKFYINGQEGELTSHTGFIYVYG